MELQERDKTALEALDGAQSVYAQQRSQADQNLIALAERRRKVLSEIEKDHGLPEGAIGTTHLIDAQAGTIVPNPHQQTDVKVTRQRVVADALPTNADSPLTDRLEPLAEAKAD